MQLHPCRCDTEEQGKILADHPAVICGFSIAKGSGGRRRTGDRMAQAMFVAESGPAIPKSQQRKRAESEVNKGAMDSQMFLPFSLHCELLYKRTPDLSRDAA